MRPPESDGGEEGVEIVDDALVEPVELMTFLVLQFRVAGERLEESGGQRCVDALEQFQEDEAYGVAVR